MGFKLAGRVLAIGLCSCALTMPALAHHFTEESYDLSKPTTLKGRVTGLVWVNPHAAILVEVRNANGSMEAWALEVAAPTTLLKAGWTKGDLSPGTPITATAFSSKSSAKADQTWTVPKGYSPSETMDLYRKVAALKIQGRMAHCPEIILADGRKLTYPDIWTKPRK